MLEWKREAVVDGGDVYASREVCGPGRVALVFFALLDFYQPVLMASVCKIEKEACLYGKAGALKMKRRPNNATGNHDS